MVGAAGGRAEAADELWPLFFPRLLAIDHSSSDSYSASAAAAVVAGLGSVADSVAPAFARPLPT